MKTDGFYYLGIDGGGTKTKFVLASGSGQIINEITLGASNPIDLGAQKCFGVLKSGIDAVRGEIPYEKIKMFAGVAGGTSGENRQKIAEFLRAFPFAYCANGSDSENVLSAGLKNGDGIAVIMGTGSCAYVQKQELRNHRINGAQCGKQSGELAVIRLGGAGYLFDYGGSGYDLGAQGISAALKSEDKTGAPTEIRNKILQRTGKKTVLESIGEWYEKGKREIASYAPLVLDCFETGDEIAAEIVRRNMRHVATLLNAAARYFGTYPVKTVFYGGLTRRFPLLRPLIEEEFYNISGKLAAETFCIETLRQDAAVGALYKAGLAYSAF